MLYSTSTYLFVLLFFFVFRYSAALRRPTVDSRQNVFSNSAVCVQNNASATECRAEQINSNGISDDFALVSPAVVIGGQPSADEHPCSDVHIIASAHTAAAHTDVRHETEGYPPTALQSLLLRSTRGSIVQYVPSASAPQATTDDEESKKFMDPDARNTEQSATMVNPRSCVYCYFRLA